MLMPPLSLPCCLCAQPPPPLLTPYPLSSLSLPSSPPSPLQVLHRADMDVQWLQRDCGLYLVGLFDRGQAAPPPPPLLTPPLPSRCYTGLTWTCSGCSVTAASTWSACSTAARRLACWASRASLSPSSSTRTAPSTPTSSSSWLTGASGEPPGVLAITYRIRPNYRTCPN